MGPKTAGEFGKLQSVIWIYIYVLEFCQPVKDLRPAFPWRQY